MKRKIILGSSAVLTIGVSIVMYVAISNSSTSSQPTQTAQNSLGSMRNEPPHNGLLSKEVAETSEKKTSAGGGAPQAGAGAVTDRHEVIGIEARRHAREMRLQRGCNEDVLGQALGRNRVG